ncbi:hypothetical protein Ahy_B09g098694 [Arachis hypogaea]|uniref:Uncharacterized protein n=1 Tax=Arachis hypogaea TaxID=3818 RepID=A0A444XRW4_ARAHY|nr:hypothetical protein Ahy_B09g098694 [Arachis hypogaea]
MRLEIDPYDRSYILYNIGLIHTSNGEHTKALEYYFRALERVLVDSEWLTVFKDLNLKGLDRSLSHLYQEEEFMMVYWWLVKLYTGLRKLKDHVGSSN